MSTARVTIASVKHWIELRGKKTIALRRTLDRARKREEERGSLVCWLVLALLVTFTMTNVHNKVARSQATELGTSSSFPSARAALKQSPLCHAHIY